jgi:hypothetical protein
MAQTFDEIPTFTSAEYAAALKTLERRISPRQRSMVIARATAPDRRMTIEELAQAADAAGAKATHSLYGGLGQLFGEALGYQGKPKYWTYLIAKGWRMDDGTIAWDMRPELAEALVAEGWVLGPRSDPPESAR